MSILSTGLGRHEVSGAAVRKTYSIEETAALLGVGRGAAYASARATGEIAGIKVIKVGRRYVLSRVAVDRLLAGDAA
jgi:hypothetical protein